MNRLADEKSPYLRHAADQKIDWYPWGAEAFDRARREEKPIFLSSGAAWCHWCHVMAKESFYNDEIAQILNERFVCIKLDRDERPDIDRIFQQAVGAMAGAGGWPLSVFLTPDAKPFYGGAYFPPDDAEGRPGFGSILLRVANIYAANRDDMGGYVAGLLDAMTADRGLPSDYDVSIIADAGLRLAEQMDSINGGFGHAPKFPMTGAYEFMLGRCFFEGPDMVFSLMKTTFAKMAMGGIHDHLQGGFHRYSTDAEWIIPHFEKMADDNARLLICYCNAFAFFNDSFFLETAEGIVRFFTEVLADPDGGFYSSQDADVTPDDEGGFFTWTANALLKCVDRAEFDLLFGHYFHDSGAMGHDPDKHVLFATGPIAETAEKTGASESQAFALINSGRKKLLLARSERVAPFIDKSRYASLNGLILTSLFHTSWILSDPDIAETALSHLNRIMKLRMPDGVLFHSDGVAAMLDDYIFFAEAVMAAYETTGRQIWMDKAVNIMAGCIERLWDKDNGGFFDSEEGVSGIRLKTIEDTPHPSPNAVAVVLLQKLYAQTDNALYKELAEKSLRAFFQKASAIGLYWASYYSALEAMSMTLRLEIYDSPTGDLASACRSVYYPYKTIKFNTDMRGFVVPCLGQACMQPVRTVQELKVLIAGLGYGHTG
jgi:uncharacterized protein